MLSIGGPLPIGETKAGNHWIPAFAGMTGGPAEGGWLPCTARPGRPFHAVMRQGRSQGFIHTCPSQGYHWEQPHAILHRQW